MSNPDDHETHALEYQDQVATMSDADLKAANMASEAGAGDPWEDALAAELEARGIDV